jgi:hypothetical protein
VVALSKGIAYLFDGYVDGVRAGAKRLGRVKQRPVPRESLDVYESVTYVQLPLYSAIFHPTLLQVVLSSAL